MNEKGLREQTNVIDIQKKKLLSSTRLLVVFFFFFSSSNNVIETNMAKTLMIIRCRIKEKNYRVMIADAFSYRTIYANMFIRVFDLK
jgi:hypothetical protein